MPAADRIGSVIASKYRLERLLGEGGMGAVYKAQHVTVGKTFAVKVLHANGSKHPDAKRRFTQEAQAAARISHPAILDVYDLGEDEGALYMVMELLAGESLAERVARGPLPITEALEYAVGVLSALEAAHSASIIHRDIKPANVFIVSGEDGRAAVRVLDFGIAKFQEATDGAKTSTGAILGSAYYMAPEQVHADSTIDGRADVWGVGAMLYELLVGEPAHLAPTHAAVIAKIVMKVAPPVSERRPDAGPTVDAIVARALTIDPERRYPSASAMREELETYLVGRAGTLPSVPPPALSTGARGRLARAGSSGGATPRPAHPATTDLTPLSESGSAAPRARSLLPLTVAALAIGVFGSLAVLSRAGRLPWARGSDATTSVAPPASPPPSSPPAPPSSPALSTASAPAPEHAPALVSARPDAAASPRPSPAAAPFPPGSARPPTSRPAVCAAGEVLSEGHCCASGFVWRAGRCERDIAVTAPF